ncbi:hypothetical protein C7974DRAFT_389676 [Boeremia exigua]|uniref:uncharacterized protein n=1 Tax=Boeremia exigua TaxID=749465 RepID=UPI001E8DA74C|nr:uncharacterized protein C7974DRAFT_389676 [Boeremia exigua]KAH6637519.1 hypothetical protein C7974DRAFT_389676 [Boeremia exigua]
MPCAHKHVTVTLLHCTDNAAKSRGRRCNTRGSRRPSRHAERCGTGGNGGCEIAHAGQQTHLRPHKKLRSAAGAASVARSSGERHDFARALAAFRRATAALSLAPRAPGGTARPHTSFRTGRVPSFSVVSRGGRPSVRVTRKTAFGGVGGQEREFLLKASELSRWAWRAASGVSRGAAVLETTGAGVTRCRLIAYARKTQDIA